MRPPTIAGSLSTFPWATNATLGLKRVSHRRVGITMLPRTIPGAGKCVFRTTAPRCENALAMVQSEQRAERSLRALLAMGHILATTAPYERVVAGMIATVSDVLDVETCGVFLH